MKKAIISFSVLFIALNVVGQSPEIQYLDAAFKQVFSSEESAYTRSVVQNEHNLFDVKVFYPGEQLKMKGHYTDAELLLAEGEFSYFYRNGQLESEGMCSGGVKYGTWKRFEWDGTPRADKYYTGTTVESVMADKTVRIGATFKGGEEALFQFIREQLIYPETALKQNIEGIVEISFVIDESGLVREVKVFKGLNYFLDKEAERLVSSLPKWEPASRNGSPEISKFILPISFRIPKK